jgi:hypothetical protein
MQTQHSNQATIEAFQSFYLAELDTRIQRSDALGAATPESGSAALFYEPASGKFTLLEKPADADEAIVYDCEPREQWGRTVMVFGHSTNTGGYIASGHGTLDTNAIKIKLANGNFYRIEVDSTLPFLAPFVSSQPNARPARAKHEKRPATGPNQVRGRQFGNKPIHNNIPTQSLTAQTSVDDESEDLTEEDLRRLRGEMPITTKSKKKWVR